MSLFKKLVRVGNSRHVAVPSAWLKALEAQHGRPVDAVLVDVDNELRIRPYFAGSGGA